MLVEKLREMQAGRSQEAVARELGISQGTLSRILRGDRKIGLDTLTTIMERQPKLASAVLDYIQNRHRNGAETEVA